MSDWYLKTADGKKYEIAGGNATIPRYGLWTADALLRTEIAPGVGQGVTLVIRGTERTGAVVRSGSPTSRASCRIVGGAGKLGTILDPRDYRGQTLSSIVADCLRDAGESVGDLSQLDSVTPQHWTRVQETASRCLLRLFRLGGDALVWRCARNGSVGVPVESWPTLDAGDVIGSQSAEDTATFAPIVSGLRYSQTGAYPDHS
jgi:hypothetical protein